MPTHHLTCGLPASGKTTLAKKLEQDLPALRLTADEWMARLVGDGYDEDKRVIVEDMLWQIAKRVLELDSDVILDYGLWAYEERQAYRDKAQAIGAQVKIHYLEVPLETLLTRLKIRNASLSPDTFYISPEDLRLWWTTFERPTDEEMQ